VTPVRPIITDTGEVIAQVPEGMTTLGQQPGGSVDRYAPEEAAAPSRPPLRRRLPDADEAYDDAPSSGASRKTEAKKGSAAAL